LMAAGKPGSPASRLLQNAVGSKTRGSLQYVVAKRAAAISSAQAISYGPVPGADISDGGSLLGATRIMYPTQNPL
jgi:hypothetical protein